MVPNKRTVSFSLCITGHVSDEVRCDKYHDYIWMTKRIGKIWLGAGVYWYYTARLRFRVFVPKTSSHKQIPISPTDAGKPAMLESALSA